MTPAAIRPSKKALVLLIDALRYDVLADPAARATLVPNLARLADRGFVVPAVANAQSTQFVMPALFSLTYPLDHGGYNNGIRERPKSYVESLRDAGFETHLMASGNQLGITMGYDRGFDSVRTTSDYRTLLEQRIGRTLKYELDLWRKGERSEADAIALLRAEFALLLRTLVESIEGHDKSIWPPALHRINRRVADGCVRELALIEAEPRAVLNKLSRIAPGVYWRFLGARTVSAGALFLARARTALSWRIREYVSAHTWFPFLTLSHRQTITGDVIPAISEFIAGAKDRPWYVHLHVMDVHDCRSVNRPLHVLGRLRYLPRWLGARLRGMTRRRFLYDSAVMYVDRAVGKLAGTIAATGQESDTVFVVIADHGSQYAESPRPKQDVGLRMHYEHIDVPLLVAGAGRGPSGRGLIDTMGISATVMDALGVPLHQSHKGIGALRPGRDAIVSESCGHGNADLARRDIYFTVTSETHRMMAMLVGSELRVRKLFDRRADPRELNDLAADPAQRPVIEGMIAHLRRERAEIFALRAAARTAVQATAAS